MPDHDTAEFRPAPEGASPLPKAALAALGCAAIAGAAWWFWLRPAEPQPAPPPPPVASAPAAPAAAPPMPEASGPQNLVDGLAPADTALPPLAESDTRVTALLGELLGSDKVTRFLWTEGFVRRVVATVDNLGRAQAPSRMWPVQPTPERFTVEGVEGAQTIAPANAARYSAVLAFAEAVPLDAAVALYARLYPLFQQAYEEVGYPRRYFNDRLVAVLDHLLLAPEPKGPMRVKLLPVNTDVPDLRPWVRYEFADPALQALSSGQKILVRMGPANAARAKALIREVRQRVATGAVARKPVP
ncbi:DUF3014 domain-containing protein [Acidovorax sp. LjRoot117]|uniref:DUF3014 domain-containing protein n=1 Tax=Acidovorax sp. LjRoot117 TaxID=3342255 RepID=UPI003ECFE4EA